MGFLLLLWNHNDISVVCTWRIYRVSGFGCLNVPISVVRVFWKCKTQVLFCFGFNLELNIHPDTRVVSGDNKHFCIWSVCRWLKRMSEAFAIRWLISANKSYCVRVHVWRQSINKIRDYWGIPTATTSSTATTLKNRNNQIIAKYKIQIIRVKKSKYENQYAPKYPLMGPQANWSGI